ncbi:hypothetical protein FS749_003916 [Ceratobasidium sp. UAMH 11750]|nr:hypothetical protein FS749_003916 [Ceratobasidium sp. UAMH 11750]
MDRSLIVLNKPPGLVAQGGRQRAQDQTLDDILDDLTSLLKLKERPLPVHRLDKPTTGALILARTKRSAQTLSQQLRNRTIQKSYLALVRRSFSPRDAGQIRQSLRITDGRVRPYIPDAKVDTIESPIRRDKSTEVRETITTWKCLGTSAPGLPAVSLLELGLCTGVKHQLRVVTASILRAPIVGDGVYGSNDHAHSIFEGVSDRLFLHSARVNITRYLRQPLNGRREYKLEVTAPLPSDFVTVCDRLGIQLDPTWTPKLASATVKNAALSFGDDETQEEDGVTALKGGD